MNLIQKIEQEEVARLTANKTIPSFAPGDTVVVSVNVVEGTRKRAQAFEGVVIAKRNRHLRKGLSVHPAQHLDRWCSRSTQGRQRRCDTGG